MLNRTKVFLYSVVSVVSVLTLFSVVSAGAPAPVKLTGGNGTLYVGGWPNKIFVIDEATEKITGTIDVTSGDPTRMVLSKDRKRFYVVNSLSEQIEVIEIRYSGGAPD